MRRTFLFVAAFLLATIESFCQSNLLLQENFDGKIPKDWTVEDNDVDWWNYSQWQYSSNKYRSAPGCVCVKQDYTSNDWLITGAVKLKSKENRLIFYERKQSFGYGRNGKCSVKMSMDDGVSFVGDDQWRYGYSSVSNSYKKHVMDLSGYGDDQHVKLAFVNEQKNQEGAWYVDDVRVIGSNIEKPGSFNATKITSDFVELSWTLNSLNQSVIITVASEEKDGLPDNGVEYDVYKNNTLPDGSKVIFKGSLKKFKHAGLLKDTPYYYKIWSFTDEFEYSLDRPLTVRTLSSETIFYEDFENGQNGWSLGRPSFGNKWRIGKVECYRGNRAVYVSNDDGSNAAYNKELGGRRSCKIWLVKEVTIPVGYKSAELSFFWKGVAEPGYDGGDVTINGYNARTRRRGNFRLTDKREMTGQKSWTEMTLDVSDFIRTDLDNKIKIKFRWYNDERAGQDPGLCIDDIRITGSDVERTKTFSGKARSQEEIQLNWTKNRDDDEVIVAWSEYGVIGRPVNGTDYKEGDYLAGGGQIVYKGPASEYLHKGLFTGKVNYKIWSVNKLTNYSSAMSTEVHIPVMLPFTEDFEGDVEAWNFNTGYDNAWVRGKATAKSGSQSAYISHDMGITASYDESVITDTHLELYVDLRGFESASLSFNWKGEGYTDDWSYERIDFGEVLIDGDLVSQSEEYGGASNWKNEKIIIPARYLGDIHKIGFRWYNSNAGSVNPGFCIDDVKITGTIARPRSFKANNFNTASNGLLWRKNAAADKVMIAWSEDGKFGKPKEGTVYMAGDVLPDGGTVIYVGDADEFTHEPLKSNTTYYYRAWSTRHGIYSAGRSANAKTPENIRFFEDFEDNSDNYPEWNTNSSKEKNKWLLGGEKTTNGSSKRAAYISANGRGAGYNKKNLSEAWLSVPIDLRNFHSANLSFYWRCKGEGDYFDVYDYGEVYLDDERISKKGEFVNSNGWQQKTIDLTGKVGGLYTLKFLWVNDNSGGSNPGFCIDDIAIAGTFDQTSIISQGGAREPAVISSLRDTEEEAFQVFDFTLKDDGHSDNVSTRLQQLVIKQAAVNNIADWKKALAGAKLYGPGLPSKGMAGTINGTNITFTGKDFIVVKDKSKGTYQLKVWLNKELDELSDGDQFGFTIESDDVVTHQGSDFAAGQSISTGAVKLDVKATALSFSVQPSKYATVNYVLQIVPQVSAVDENGNLDLDFVGRVNLSNSEKLSMSPVAVKAVGGVAIFNDLTIKKTGAVTLTAAASGVSRAISDEVIIQNYCVPAHNRTPERFINNVIFNTINNTTGDDGGYGVYLDQQTSLTLGKRYDLIMGVSNSSRTAYVFAWVDWNQNDQFEKSEKISLGQMSTGTRVMTKEIIVSRSAKTGFTRMRVQITGTSNPASACGNNYAGESEDYLIEVTNNAWQGRSTIWDSRDNWSEGTVPTTVSNVVIPEHPRYGKVFPYVTGEAQVNNMAIAPQANVSLAEGAQFTVHGNLDLQGIFRINTATDNVTSFLPMGTITGTGTTEVYFKYPSRMWWYFGHAVDGVTSGDYNAADLGKIRLYQFDTRSRKWSIIKTNTVSFYEPLKGYHVNFRDKTIVKTAGVLHNKDYSVDELSPGWHLVTNPYSAYLDLDLERTNPGKYWTFKRVYRFIYMRSFVGGERVITIRDIKNPDASHPATSSLLAPMQAFWVKSAGGGEFGVTTAARKHDSKHGNFKAATVSADNIIKLTLANEHTYDYAAIAFDEDGTDEFAAHDGEKYVETNKRVPQLHTLKSGVKTAINVLPEVIDQRDVPVYITIGSQAGGEQTLKVINMADFRENTAVHLEDLVKGVKVDLRANPEYHFTTQPVKDQQRFVIHFEAMQGDLSTDIKQAETDEQTAEIFGKDGKVMVNLSADYQGNTTQVNICSIDGALIYSGQFNGDHFEHRVARTNACYVVKLIMGEKVVSKKIFIKKQ
ncbi:hypothetical protein DMA11_10065 [Marinilabiliaceae bacterium JC017]|nr:hypothetical protein DMA11_10065 [Marinilabiliaceae bacterium JC017]